MTRLIRFHKAFLPAAIFSAALLVFGAVGLLTKGFNLGVDFQAGVNQYVQLAYPAASIGYSGEGNPVLTLTDAQATVVFSGADVMSRTVTWDLRTVGTLADLAGEMSAEGISLVPREGGLSADLLVPTYQGEYVLSASPLLIHRAPKDESERYGSVQEVRAALGKLSGDVSVQSVGGKDSGQYIIRVQDPGEDPDFIKKVPALVAGALNDAFGADRTVTMKSDYVGARFAQGLIGNTWKLTLLTILLIMVYSTIRFKLQFAIGAVLAILHDALIIVGFIVWTRMEFNTSSIAAILTILGYSINDTIVIFDRIREDHRLSPTDSMTTIIDRSMTETLGRTIITTITTMLTVLALYFFTSGNIKDFALALLVGMISGTYSTIFIASGFVSLWDKLSRKNQGKREAKDAVATATP